MPTLSLHLLLNFVCKILIERKEIPKEIKGYNGIKKEGTYLSIVQSKYYCQHENI